jgi:thiol-disulfide isomerase/thioredoxin
VGAILATFVAARDHGDAPNTAANSGDVLGLTPLGKGSDLIGKKLPQAGVVTLDGAVTDLPAVTAGRPALVNFFSKTCVPCVKEMPDLQAQFMAADGKLPIIGVDVGDTADATRTFVAQTKVTYPIVRDPQSLVLNGFGVGSLPTTIAVDADGAIVGQHYGAFGDGELAAFVAEHFPAAG